MATRYVNVGTEPLDRINKHARRVLKDMPDAYAVLIVTIGERNEMAAAGRGARLTPSDMVMALRAAADKIESETRGH